MIAMEKGINRNIVECKVRYLDRERVCADRINRNIVECKAIPLCHRQIPGIVLIETSWNVKLGTSTHKTARIPY